MACKDCIHFGICKEGFPWADGKGGGWCENFKDKAKFVEVPCRVGDTVYIVLDKGIDKGIVEQIIISSVSNKDVFQIEVLCYGYDGETVECYEGYTLEEDDFGKWAFLTEAEAEKALKGGADNG